jgi:hypothetical protein
MQLSLSAETVFQGAEDIVILLIAMEMAINFLCDPLADARNRLKVSQSGARNVPRRAEMQQ